MTCQGVLGKVRSGRCGAVGRAWGWEATCAIPVLMRNIIESSEQEREWLDAPAVERR